MLGNDKKCCRLWTLRRPSRSNSTISSTVSRKVLARAAGDTWPTPIGIAFAAFQLYVAAFNYLPSQVVRGVHVGFLILMTFGLIGNFTAKSNAGRAAGWLIGSAGFLCGLYQWIFYADLIARDGDPTRLDLVVGTLLAVLIFEGTRRLMGLALPLMCGACILYWFFGQYLPAPFNHRGYGFDQIITPSRPTAPKAFTACRSTSRRPTSSCSSCSARSSSAPG